MTLVEPRELQEPVKQLLSASWAADLLALAIAPAVCEELLFRGALQSSIANRWLALVVPAVAFGAFHASPKKFLPAAALGLLLGAIRARAGSLWPAVAFHAANNTLVLVLARCS
jgi:membrane protease YdiL (CAAX protease family)